ncbi:organic solute transporter Ostalpha-domain-containing protein [Gamsiella multidivaricata]|uniref:organic solute transporter Ostalpha-domain-containing protein n=1 Tax=Gamsiella multidivaricata TaxID=101098 RepID=UPI00221EF15B|nr:organic solute transporter Ostalpha-domain-containing protein [Gamsiella multidivaricata]KAI7823020.1 organic solute transporter Ostalpha-domain-containing protein [Gamsiella multidivaricata]
MNNTQLMIDERAAADSPGAGSGDELPSSAVWAAGIFAFSATFISMVAIWMQFKHYRKPLLQRYVVRILWMVPIFAISSWISLVSLNMSFYVDALRDIYEAFVIYCFFGLLVSYLGGERSLLIMLHGRPYTKHVFPVSLWYREIDVGDPYSFLFIKRGILQYVYVKPVLAAVTMLLKSNDAYNDGSVSFKSGYFWVSFIYNISVCLSLYCLGIFFMATQGDLEEFRPIPKFLCIKAVIFFSFWQGFAISILVSVGIMSNTSPEIAVAIQDWLICFEMVFASVGHWYAFSHKDYTDIDIQSARMPVYYAIRDACGIQDIVQDSLETLKGTRFTYRTFEPSEGLATEGMSRSGRINAGLRYSQGGTTKYWLPETNAIPGSTMSQNDRFDSDDRRQFSRHPRGNAERPPSLYFPDLDEEDEDGLEELYDASKQLEFGDYNFPAIDVHDPKEAQGRGKRGRRGPRKSKKKEARSLLTDPNGAQEPSRGSVFGKEGWSVSPSSSRQQTGTPTAAAISSASSWNANSAQARDGCVDNVNNYVPEPRTLKAMRSSTVLSPMHQRSAEQQQQQQRQNQHPLDDQTDSQGGPALFIL